jgi:hypothetical protein
VTDDRGEYRLTNLPEGAVTVAILTSEVVTIVRLTSPGQIAPPRPAWKTYYPGVTAAAEAERLRLQPGDERQGIDFELPSDRAAGLDMATMTFISVANAAPGPNDTGAVRGLITTPDGRPLHHARVDLTTSGTGAGPMRGIATRHLFTEADGRFEFRDLPASVIRIVVSKPGYFVVASDPPKLDPAALEYLFGLKPGETRDHVDFTLARWSVVTGRVFDEYGDPVQGASVDVLHIRYEGGQRRLSPASPGPRSTNDLGEYRVYGLQPGQYIVSASAGAVSGSGSSAELPGYGRSYYPGTPNAGEALFVGVGRSQDAGPADFALPRIRTARVSGVALRASGERSAAGSLKLIPSQRSSSPTSVELGARINPDDSFEFPNVPPGDYVIQLYRGRSRPWIEGEFAALRVLVDGDDVAGLVLQTQTGSSITGTITWDTAGVRPPPRSLELSPIPVDLDSSPSQPPALAEVDSSWRFTMEGISGLRRLTVVRPPDGWALKEIRVNGVDVTDQPMLFGRREQSLSDVEVVLTDRVNEIAASVADDKARPVSGASLIVFSLDRDKWYSHSRFMGRAVAGTDGAASIRGLPDGAYYAAAVRRAPADGDDAWQDPEYLDTMLRSATTVTLQAGQRIGPLSLVLGP